MRPGVRHGFLLALLLVFASGCPETSAPTTTTPKKASPKGSSPKPSPTESDGNSNVAGTSPGPSTESSPGFVGTPTGASGEPVRQASASPASNSPTPTLSVGISPSPGGSLAPSANPSGSPSPSPAASFGPDQPHVSTFAGTAIGLEDGTGTAAQFNQPNGIDFDAAGNLYVADAGNHRIRKVSPAGVVTTVAGSTSGYGEGSGGTARFNSPYGLAVAPDGTVFVADTKNHCIRKIATNGTVTTFAGTGLAGFADGAGNVARFKVPFSVAVDNNGDVYVADTGNHRIRKITPAGLVSTVVGGIQGNASGTLANTRFSAPNDVAFAGTGVIYVADTNNHRICKVEVVNDKSSTLAGSGVAGSNNGVGNSASFNLPTGIALDTHGNVFVADSQSNAVRRISPLGEVTTLCGSKPGFLDGLIGVALFDEPTDVAVDGSGRISVADAKNHRLRRIE